MLRPAVGVTRARLTYRAVDAVERGADVAPLVEKLRARQVERDTLVVASGAAEAVIQIQRDRRAVTRQVLAQVATWRRLLSAERVEDGLGLQRWLCAN